jgi:hypothetical protein
MALTDSLVAYWSLDEASGTRVDATGRGNDLSEVGSPGSTTGKISNAVDTSSGNYLSRASTSDLVTGDIDFTCSAWVWFDAVSPDSDIVNKWATGGFEYTLALDSVATKFRFYVEPSGFHSITATTFGVVTTGTWYFVVWWHDAAGNTLNICVNDGGVDTVAHTTGVTTATAAFVIGRSAFGSHDGRVDEVGLWKRVLTSGERTQLYNAGAGLAYSAFGTAGGRTLVNAGLVDGGLLNTGLAG